MLQVITSSIIGLGRRLCEMKTRRTIIIPNYYPSVHCLGMVKEKRRKIKEERRRRHLEDCFLDMFVVLCPVRSIFYLSCLPCCAEEP